MVRYIRPLLTLISRWLKHLPLTPAIWFHRVLSQEESQAWEALRLRFSVVALSDQPTTYLGASPPPLSSRSNLCMRSYRKVRRLTWLGGYGRQLCYSRSIFLWQMFGNRLPTSVNMAKRQGPSNGACAVCAVPEDANHVFFGCHLARFALSAVREASGLSWNPRSSAKMLGLLTA